MKIVEKLELMWEIPILFVQENKDGSGMLHGFGTYLDTGNPLRLNDELVEKLLKQSLLQKEPVVYCDENREYFA